MLTKIKNELIYLSTLRRILSSLKLINNDESAIITKKIAGYADSSPDSIAIYFEDKKITYRELINGANQYSHWFLDNGLQKGDVVALLMENRPEFLMAWIGIAQVGGTSALINTNLTGNPLNHSLRISGASKLILGKELISNFETTDTIHPNQTLDGLIVASLSFCAASFRTSSALLDSAVRATE